MARALVTGVAGFIGSHIAERLLREGHEVIGIDDLSAGYMENIPEDVQFTHMDVCEIKKYPYILEGVEVIFHQAASKKNICLRDPARDMEVNGIGVLNLLQECVRMKVDKFVHASTGSVYGEVDGLITETMPLHPVSYYGVSKMAGETYVSLFHKMYKLDTTILRYFHVYGDRQEKKQDTGGVIAIFSDKIQRGEDIIIHGDGQQKRVFTYVEDIVNANLRAWMHPLTTGRVFNCASSKKTSIVEVAKMLMNKYNKRVSIQYESALVGDIYNFDVDTSRIRELGIHFRPITDMI